MSEERQFLLARIKSSCSIVNCIIREEHHFGQLFTWVGPSLNLSVFVCWYNSQKQQLSRWCTVDLKTSIRQLLPEVLDPELARQLSLKGQNRKKGVANTKVMELVEGRYALFDICENMHIYLRVGRVMACK